jgi:hypothetical protein
MLFLVPRGARHGSLMARLHFPYLYAQIPLFLPRDRATVLNF